MRFGLVAGEASGDLLGAGLIRSLRQRFPDAEFEGVAGPEMIAAGCSRWADSEELAVMGLVEPLRHLPRLLKLRRSLVERWTASPPDVFIGIDAPDFNLGLETALKEAGVRTAHYVSPSIWAWRPGRVHKVKAAADLVLCILPFEPQLYAQHGVNAVFVGHPKATELSDKADLPALRAELGLDRAAHYVAVLPGSRKSEVSRLGPVFVEAATQLADSVDGIRFLLPAATPALRSLVEDQLAGSSVADRFSVFDGDSIRVMQAADVVMLASGTAVLESALLGKPTVAAYILAPMTYLIIRTFRMMQTSHYTLPNQLTDTPLVPELMQQDARPELIAAAVREFLVDADRRAAVREGFAKMRAALKLDADERAAEAVARLASQ